MTAGEGRARIRLLDVALAALFVFVGLGGTEPAGVDQPYAQQPGLLAHVLVVLTAVAVVAWRPFPLPVFAVTGALTAIYLLLGYPFGPILFPAAFAVGALAATRPLRLTTAVVAVDVVVVGVVLVVRMAGEPVPGFAVLMALVWSAALWFAAPVAVGSAVRVRRDSRVRVRTEQARRAVSEERLRMAQEVHDVVGHGLAVIAMQAGVGLHVVDRDPAKARDALSAIRDTSREALDGLRAELAMLRGDTEAASRRPGVGLSDIEALVERVRSSGLDVAVEIQEPEGAVGEQIELAAYRIVQESLTNVLRHAGPEASARVRVRQARDALTVEVTDLGTGPPAGGPAAGNGIVGMRERAAAVGGHLEATGRPGTGFTVRARLPMHIAAERGSA